LQKKTVSIIGSTGSIGTQALEVVRMLGYKVSSLAAGKNINALESQIREFRPKVVAMADDGAARELR
jgi:1-deoxy-D-xylulose-5-phosphate reductoisomerase